MTTKWPNLENREMILQLWGIFGSYYPLHLISWCFELSLQPFAYLNVRKLLTEHFIAGLDAIKTAQFFAAYTTIWGLL